MVSKMVPHNSSSTTKEMATVIFAMLPGLFALGWIFGPGVWIHVAIVVPTAMVAEAAILLIRGRNPINELNDLSAILTALLLAASLPPLLPWWMTLLGTLFAIILAKQLYGGLGQNPFNPAMIGYVILLVSFPLEMTSWLPAAGIQGVKNSLKMTLNVLVRSPIKIWRSPGRDLVKRSIK